MFSLTHYPNDTSKKQSWVDPSIVEKDDQSQITGNGQITVEPGEMFDELNQTSPAFSIKNSHQPKVSKQMGVFGTIKQKNSTATNFNKKKMN